MNQHSAEELNIAILHDRFPQIGGGEAFAIEAARVLDAPIYTMYISEGVEIPDDITVVPIQQQKYTHGFSGHFLEWKNEGMNPLETLNVGLDMASGHPDITDQDVVLSSAPLSKAYVPEVNQTVVHYPHSPSRWLYDLYRDRIDSFDYPLIGAVVRGYARLWRCFDKEANDYVTRFIANSELVRDRIRTFYARDADVVYPPITGDWYNDGDEGYFITWSRLAPEKRISLIAEAFTELDERLVIAGDGEERARLDGIARDHENIEVRGFVDDIQALVANATAVVYAPVQEDFGLVGAEALTAGKPLLGVNEGFTKSQVEEGVTGHAFDPTVESIRNVVETFEPDAFDTETIQTAAQKYSYDKFRQGLRQSIVTAHRQGRYTQI